MKLMLPRLVTQPGAFPARFRTFVSRCTLTVVGVWSVCAVTSYAAIPYDVTQDPLYAKGYLKVTLYPGVSNSNSNAGTTTDGINQALKDARTYGFAVYFPAGTYLVNDTLKAHTATGSGGGTHGIVMMGSTSGARPVIKLAGMSSFDDYQHPKVVVEFKNFSNVTAMNNEDGTKEVPNQGYESMIRGIDINCNAVKTGTSPRNRGAIGLYMNLAQECSIENVKITATDAHTGIRGLPARGWGAVNIEIEGGDYGIDTYPDPLSPATASLANLGSVVVGAKLSNQMISAIRHTGHPLTVVGFEITTPSNSGAAIKMATEGSTDAHAGALALVDGKITLLGTFSGVAAIDNSLALRNLYVRNVYVTGTNNLVKSNSVSSVSGGTWKLIEEYNFAKATTNFDSKRLKDGTMSTGQLATLNGSPSPSSPPSDLRTRHVWSALPSVDDAGITDPVNGDGGVVSGDRITLDSTGTATVSAAKFQRILDNYTGRVFLPAGTYKIDGPITLKYANRLFGTARNLTHIVADWVAAPGEVFVTAQNSAAGAIYLGDIEVSVYKPSSGSDYMSALLWQAGKNSMLHIASIGQAGAGALVTTGKSLVQVRQSGGGRWYFFGRRDGSAMQHDDFRVLDVDATSSPFWIYGMNMEHSRSDVFADFKDCQKIRIYGAKTEFAGEYENPPNPYRPTTFFSFTGVQNVALIGHSGLRYSSISGCNSVEFQPNASNTNSTDVLAALIAPQENKDAVSPATGTLWEKYGNDTNKVTYPATVSLFKRGNPVDSAMTHDNPAY